MDPVTGAPSTVETLLRENAHLRALLAEAARLAEFGRYAAKLNHELRQPLFAIKGLAQLLLDRNERVEPEETREFARSIVEQAERLGLLVNHLRALSVPPERRGPAGPDATDVGLSLRKVIDLLGARFHRGATVSPWLEPELPRARIAEDALQQIFINLLTNALDAVDGRGAIQVSARRKVRDDADGAGRAFLEIAVGDNGPGISVEARSRLFEPFFSTKEPGSGTGLGLVVSRDLARAAGGDLVAIFGEDEAKQRFSAPVRTVFAVILPVAADASAATDG